MLEESVNNYKNQLENFNAAHAKLRHNKAIIKVRLDTSRP